MNTVAVLCNDEIEEDRPMPSRNHSRVAQRIGVLLDRYSEKFDVHQQLSLQLGGWDSIPDIAVYPVGVLSMDLDTDEEEVSVPPLLAIEILSPKQNLQPLVEKVRRFL
ncbi:MAG: Uma2 family endonuclease, partial [Roseimicrobium sp.]